MPISVLIATNDAADTWSREVADIDDRVIGRDALKEASSCLVGRLLVDIEHAVPGGLGDLGRVDESIAHQQSSLCRTLYT
ncbi:MAG: hypothetical protein E6I91_08040 [Chloroflexi bacterium]|nr:MAG: hypothetical protein E6I91_08040 [Chloroflexota bacterium]